MKKMRWIYRVCFVLLFGMFFSILPGGRESVQAEKKQLYALEITTGSSGTSVDKLQAIVVNYKDEGNRTRTYCIFPQTALKETVAKVKSKAGQDSSFVNESKIRTAALNECEETLDLSDQERQFIPYTTQILFFTPYFKINSLESVKIITSGSASWSIQGMRLIEVDESSVTMVGNAVVSSNMQASYKGTRLAELSGTMDMAWTSSNVFCAGNTQSKSEAYFEPKGDDYATYDEDRDSYLLKLDIADEYLAGLESLATESGGTVDIHGMKPADLLFATIYYEDIYGDVRVAKMPVISNVLAEIQGKNGSVIGLAQQGESLAFTCRLPGIQKVITDKNKADHGIDLTLGMDHAKSSFGISLIRSDTTNYTASGRNAVAKNTKDLISITSVGLYKNNEVSFETDLSENELKYILKGTGESEAVPAYYFAYKKNSGRMLEYGQTQKFALEDNTISKSVMPAAVRDVSNLYLVEVSTANMKSAATTDDLKISLTYKTLGESIIVESQEGVESEETSVKTGNQKTSEEYVIKEKVTELYGYWPATGQEPEYLMYHEGTSVLMEGGTSKGGTLRFLVSLSNVDSFVSATISVSGRDEWQSAGIRISRVTSIAPRSAKFEKKEIIWGANKTVSDRVFDRQVESQSIAYSGEQVLIRSNKSKTIYFTESKSVVDNPDSGADWDPTAEKMDYETACSDLGFSKSRMSYNVDVTVAGASAGDSANGDCGSKNFFYFRLNFVNGSSSYVLANQQLSGDGFRTGQTERFSISTNLDYGELISVDVIPDDISSGGNVYDKLNIARIRVSRGGTGSLNRSWEISNPGWIGVNYEEEALKNKESGYEGRYEGELAKNFMVDKTSYNVKLMFAIATGTYDEGENPFSGTVSGTLYYTNSSNESKTMSFDMVREMYSFMQTETQESDYSTGSLSLCKPNTSLMFRENSTDRFFLDLDDVKSVDRLTLTVRDSNSSTWKIKSIGVSLVSDLGQLVLNSQDEYVYTGTSEELTQQDSDSDPAYIVTSSMNTETTIKIGFKENEINIHNEDIETASATITRKPGGKNDILNIFVFPRNAEMIASYNMKTDFRYVNAYGSQFYNEVNTMKKNDTCFYVLGISARDFSLLNSVGLKATAVDGTNKEFLGDYIIVQHVRAGVVLDTWRLDNYNYDLTAYQSLETGGEITNNETQEVSLYFGEGTSTDTLSENQKNIAVSIGFKSSLGNDEKIYHSPYVFLTDEIYDQIRCGMIADVDFHIPYVKEITDIQIAGIGKLDATIDGAVVATYTGDEAASLKKIPADASEEEKQEYQKEKEQAAKGRKCTGWYSFDIHAPVTTGTVTYSNFISDTSQVGILVPVTLELFAGKANTSTDMDMGLTINYIDAFNRKQSFVIASVQSWMDTDSSFGAEESIKLQFMLKDVEKFLSIEVQTLGTGNIYQLESAALTWNNLGTFETLSRYIAAEVSTRGYKISLVDADLYVEAESVPQGDAAKTQFNSKDNPDMNFALAQGDQLNVSIEYESNPVVDNWKYQFFRVTETGSKSTVADEKSVLTVSSEWKSGDRKNSGGIIIDTSGLDTGSYELRVYAEETGREVIVKFTVTESKLSEPSTETGDDSEDNDDQNGGVTDMNTETSDGDETEDTDKAGKDK